MFTFVKDYFKRHRKGIFIISTLTGGIYLASNYAVSKLKDVQEKATAERLAKE
ncbi:hypothetical protein CU098_000672, partial [Rhizopus stolonifer]